MADQPVHRAKRQGNPPSAGGVKDASRIAPLIIQKYATGMLVADLAKELRLKKYAVTTILIRNNIPIRKGFAAIKATRSISGEDHPSFKHGRSFCREYRTDYQRQHRRDNPDAYRDIDSRRRDHINHMPKWADKGKIREIYRVAREAGLTVDHIIPLQGEHICGLHVESNLQLLTASENSAKGTKCDWLFDPLVRDPI